MIIIHECGHFLCAIILKIEVDKIYIYPLGGISKFNLSLNSSIKKEFLILVMGPIFQELAKNLLLILLPKYHTMILFYHYGILLFNLLPIYPLDGGKLVNLLLASFYPIKRSLIISIYISYIIVISLFIININNLNLNIIIISIFLIYKITKEHQQINYSYNKFLLERYLNNYHFKKSKIINNKEKFYRNNYHLIKIGDIYYKERDFLKKIYKKH